MPDFYAFHRPTWQAEAVLSRQPLTFGSAVTEARRGLALTQGELAQLIRKPDGCCISTQYLSELERDRRPPADYMVDQFAEALRIPREVLWFMTGRFPPELRTSSADFWQIQGAFQAFRLVLEERTLPARERVTAVR